MNIVLSSKVLLAGALCAFGLASAAQAAPKHVLVVTTTLGFHHSSIPTAEKVIAKLGDESGAFTVDYVRFNSDERQYRGDNGRPDPAKYGPPIKALLAEKMSPEALKHYDAVIFANTTGDLPLPDKEAFLDWVKSGKGFVGMHSATDTFHGFPGYIDMIGAEFRTHDAQVSVDALNQDQDCPICRHLPADWKVFDEIYQFKNYDRTKYHDLLCLDKSPKPNNRSPGYYPVSWCKEYGKGRVFYTSLGHREDVWDPSWPDRRNPAAVAEAYQKLILQGIKWAVGLEKMDAKPQKTAVE